MRGEERELAVGNKANVLQENYCLTAYYETKLNRHRFAQLHKFKALMSKMFFALQDAISAVS